MLKITVKLYGQNLPRFCGHENVWYNNQTKGTEMSKKVYTEEFKKDAIRLAFEIKNVSKAARQLGIKDTLIHNWKKQYKLTESGITESEHAEIKRLKKEVEELKKSNYILSRAAAFFSQDHLK